jgi:hypothetical protein
MEICKSPPRHSPAKAARRAGSQPAWAGQRVQPAPSTVNGCQGKLRRHPDSPLGYLPRLIPVIHLLTER